MLALPFATTAILVLTVYLVVIPVFNYFRDPKGFRRYPNFATFAGVSDLPYCWLSARGFRSRDLCELHKKQPILRIGPNALSFDSTAAIKDICGHTTKCIKDKNYQILSGSHTHLVGVVDKSDHSRKRKLISAAFAIKNLERWEFKVADVTDRLLAVLDGKCTSAMVSPVASPDPADLTVDFNQIINLWTIEAINNIALSSKMGLIEQGTDEVTAERMNGKMYRARYRQSQNQTSRAQAVFLKAYSHYTWLTWLSKVLPY